MKVGTAFQGMSGGDGSFTVPAVIPGSQLPWAHLRTSFGLL